MPNRDDFLGLTEPDKYELGASDALAIIDSLLRIVLAFMPDAETAKGHVDRVAAIVANEVAEEAERRKFGR